MSNSFLFLIPLTPASHLTKVREELQEKCLTALKNQKYDNWKALLIGAEKPTAVEDNRFIHLAIEDIKEIKIQYATKYLEDNKLSFDYIIRLDDDDLISYSILEQFKSTSADLIVDLDHWFIDWNTKRVSKDFKPWFPNTCIHKSKNALATFGKLANPKVKQISKSILLIENDHSKIHEFYKGKDIVFTETNIPVYLRALNPDSITSNSDSNYSDYLKKYGNWNQSLPSGFSGIDSPKVIKSKVNLKSSIHSKISKLKFKLYLKK